MLIPASSTEYLHVPVAGPSGVDLAAAPVRIAVVAHRSDPIESEWQPAEWADGKARTLIGPGTAIVLARGDYHVWISVDVPGPENITRRAGHLGVT
ncbi:hypothetical protein [Streptomyces sp.]|uniref:hypothetical protein n=1 Tax=Streptomyces sp. TaxID=1931 RepID=UPI002811600D|nr:hypothetical protein [Streptomyces sp.]